MRTFKAAVLVAALVCFASPVLAQEVSGGRHHHGAQKKTPEQPKKKVDEKAYNAALKGIPDSKEKPDPWGGMR